MDENKIASGNDADKMDDQVKEKSVRNEKDVSTENMTNETTEEISTEAIVDNGYNYQYSDIEFLKPYDETTHTYSEVQVDNRPYLSTEVNNASINDVYTMVLSIRNIVLLWFLFWLIIKSKNMIHSVLDIVMERSKRSEK